MTEWRVADVVRPRQCFGQILVQPQRPRHGPRNLGDFDAVGQPNAEMITVGRDENLCLVPQTSKADRMDDSVAVALKGRTRAACLSQHLEMLAPTTKQGVTGIRRTKIHLPPTRKTSWPASLLKILADTPPFDSALTSARASAGDFIGPTSKRLVALNGALQATRPFSAVSLSSRMRLHVVGSPRS